MFVKEEKQEDATIQHYCKTDSVVWAELVITKFRSEGKRFLVRLETKSGKIRTLDFGGAGVDALKLIDKVIGEPR